MSRRGMSLVTTLVIVWLIIGAIAAWQREYFKHTEPNCVSTGTTAVTVIAGPLNYFGVNPKVSDCKTPQPSK